MRSARQHSSLTWSELTVAQAIVAIRGLLEHATASRGMVIGRLVRLLHAGKLNAAAARANALWLITQYGDATIMPDALRIATRSFVDETPAVKLQTLNLAAKLHAVQPQLYQHIMLLARYDLDFDVRDRARFLAGLCTLPRADEILAFRPPKRPALSDDRIGLVGSIESLVGKRVAGSAMMPSWAKVRSDPALRAEAAPAAPASAPRTASSSSVAPALGRTTPVVLTPRGSSPALRPPVARNLDDFLASDEDEETSEEEASSEEEESDSGDDGPRDRPT